MEIDRIIELIFMALTSIGTVGAVIISLSLMLRESRIRTRITYKYDYSPQVDRNSPTFDIVITNISHKMIINLDGFFLSSQIAWLRMSNINKVLGYSESFTVKIPFYKLYEFLSATSNQNIDKVDIVFFDTTGRKYNKKLSIEEAALNNDLDTSRPKIDLYPHIHFEKAFDWVEFDRDIEEKSGSIPLIFQDEDVDNRNNESKPTLENKSDEN